MASGTPHLARNRGFERRLHQHGRRSGLAVGLAMAAAVAVLVVGSVVIFVRVQPLVSDFISQVTPRSAPLARDADPTPVRVAGRQATPVPTAGPSPTPAQSAFAPDLQVNPAGPAVRLRAEPSTGGGETTIVDTLAPGTPLEATGRQESSADPSQPGVVWLAVRTESNQQGWIRRIDTVPFNP